MKKLSYSLLAAVAVAGFGSASALAQTASTTSPYSGNGAGGFGGQLGPSLLSVSDDANTGVITFSLATRNADGTAKNDGLGNDVALYIDSVAGGLTDTSSLTDTGDAGRRAISGNGTTTPRSLVNFAPGFGADFAIHFNGSGAANLFTLTTPPNSAAGTLGFVAGANYSHTAGTNLYGFSINATDIGLTAGGSFAFVATLLNASDTPDANGNAGVYRSNETIGDSNVNNNTANLGQGTLTYTDFDTVPEPATYVAGVFAVLLGGVQLARRRRALAL